MVLDACVSTDCLRGVDKRRQIVYNIYTAAERSQDRRSEDLDVLSVRKHR